MTQAILIVEDDDALRSALRRYLRRSGTTVLEARTCNEAFSILEEQTVSVVLADISLPDGLGFELVDRAARLTPRPSVIIMTGDDSIDNAIHAVQYGAADFLLKPFSFEALDDAIERADRRQNPLGARGSRPDATPIDEWRRRHAPNILGSHPSLIRVFSIIERVSDTDCSVLITGESGTGKELVARALHTASNRRDRPFVTVNCAAIPENLLESELFGHTKGAFTGATNARVGRFTAADGGTIFLDELGEMPVSLQAKLLRVLQEKEISPVGESRSHRVDVRVIAATNRDLDELVDKGQFREDLLYRLNVIPIELPSLKERRCDIPDLVMYFIERANERRDRRIDGIRPEAMDRLKAYDWPGNIRQLENTVERMVVLKSEGELVTEDLPSRIRSTPPMAAGPIDRPALPEDGIDLRDAVERFENALILQALQRTGWNKNKAASILRMNRTTLVEKLKKKRLDPNQAAA